MKNRSVLMRGLVERAMRGVESLPASQQADLHEAAAIALRPFDRRRSDVAQHTAGLFRQAEDHQLQFLALLQP